jgi:hypothetical protein
MSFLKKVAGAMFEFEDKSATSSTPPPEITSESGRQVPPRLNRQITGTTPDVPSASMSVDEMQKFKSHFEDLFEKANLPGPDYFEFSKMCQAMALPDETKFPAIFAGLSIQGLTKQKLVESGKHYIAIVEEDAANFNTAVDQKIMSEVASMRQTALMKEEELRKKEDLIVQLQNEIAGDKTAIVTLKSQADEKEQKAKEKFNTYKAACDAIKSTIEVDLNKISTLIS